MKNNSINIFNKNNIFKEREKKIIKELKDFEDYIKDLVNEDITFKYSLNEVSKDFLKDEIKIDNFLKYSKILNIEFSDSFSFLKTSELLLNIYFFNTESERFMLDIDSEEEKIKIQLIHKKDYRYHEKRYIVYNDRYYLENHGNIDMDFDLIQKYHKHTKLLKDIKDNLTVPGKDMIDRAMVNRNFIRRFTSENYYISEMIRIDDNIDDFKNINDEVCTLERLVQDIFEYDDDDDFTEFSFEFFIPLEYKILIEDHLNEVILKHGNQTNDSLGSKKVKEKIYRNHIVFY